MHTSSMHILFAIEHGKGDQVFKLEKMYHFKKILAHLEFQSSNMSQKLGTGSFLVLCNACSLNNSLSGNWGGMLLYIPWYRILAAQHLRFFCLMIFQMFSVGEKSELQSGQFNTQNFFTTNLCCCNRCSKLFSIVLLKYATKTTFRWEHLFF